VGGKAEAMGENEVAREIHQAVAQMDKATVLFSKSEKTEWGGE